VVLRIREPGFEAGVSGAGRIGGAISVAYFHCSCWDWRWCVAENETVLGMNGLVFGTVIIFAGFVVYLGTAKLRRRTLRPAIVEHVEAA